MFLYVGLCLGLAAFGIFMGAVLAYFIQKRTRESRVAASGTVVELESKAARRGYIYCPVVEFALPAGETVRFTSEFGTRPASHSIGQTVEVRYDPADPQKAEIDSPRHLWTLPVILSILGVIACCVSIALVVTFVLQQPSIAP